jgi:hypothetical protein
LYFSAGCRRINSGVPAIHRCRCQFAPQVEVSERLLIPAFWLLLVAVLAGTVVPTRAESKDAQLRAAQLKMQAREFASAEEILRALLAEDPRSSVAHNLLGICQERTGQHEAAR